MTPDGPPEAPRREGDRALGPRTDPLLTSNVTLRNAAMFMAVVIAGFVVKSLQSIITPLVVAAFLLLLIDGFSRAVAARLPRWPEWLRLTLAAGLIIAGFAAIVGVVIHYGRPFAGEVGVLEPKLDQLVAIACQRLEIEPVSVRDLIQRGSPSGLLGKGVGALRGTLSGSLLTTIYLGFMLASRRAFSRKMQHLFRSDARRAHAGRVFERVREAAEAYAGLQTLKALLMAVASWVIMASLGLHNAIFLAFLIFVTAYIPILGGLVGAVLPTLLALAQFDNLLHAMLLLALLGAAIFLIESVLLPKLQSDRLNLDPVSILLALGFFGVLLGVPGALLSTPLAVVVMAVASEFEGARWLAVLLSKEGVPTDDGGENDRT